MAEDGKAEEEDEDEVDKAEAARAEAVGEGETEGAPTTNARLQSPLHKKRFSPCSFLWRTGAEKIQEICVQ